MTARPGCAWSAASNDSFLTVTGGASGSGRGVVTYTVAEHTGTARRAGTLTVGNATVSIDQIGTGTPGICRRSRPVREAMLSELQITRCWNVTARDVAGISPALS